MTYLDPALPLFLLLALLGCALAWKNSSPGKRPRLLTLGVLGLLILSWEPASWFFAWPLEGSYHANQLPDSGVGAIVVLAGAVLTPGRDIPIPIARSDTYDRFQWAIWLHKTWKPLPILGCGGGNNPHAYATAMRHILETEGVSPDSIWIESASRNTHENAQFGAEILREHGISHIVLVTDASSMSRAAASFRKQGITVSPAAFSFQRWDWRLKHMFPSRQALETNSVTLHEAGGLLWYRLMGWI